MKNWFDGYQLQPELKLAIHFQNHFLITKSLGDDSYKWPALCFSEVRAEFEPVNSLLYGIVRFRVTAGWTNFQSNLDVGVQNSMQLEALEDGVGSGVELL